MPDSPMVPRQPDPRRRAAERKRAFAARRRGQRVVLGALLTTVIAVVALADSRTQAVLGVPASTWAPAVFSAIAGGFAYSYFNWRCPACNRYLGKQLNPRLCGRCGVRLQ